MTNADRTKTGCFLGPEEVHVPMTASPRYAGAGSRGGSTPRPGEIDLETPLGTDLLGGSTRRQVRGVMGSDGRRGMNEGDWGVHS